ncbi:MAG: hypothetical protein GY724_21525 [Actinomycetia bacterium]|nr:hypothetical protein [Actinomycetes bacterium]MCP4224505.1 hypothetical protein [Actinomycetes bacterium]MCP5032569.1 hypothetical protein [Actinomycetes bacterium]
MTSWSPHLPSSPEEPPPSHLTNDEMAADREIQGVEPQPEHDDDRSAPSRELPSMADLEALSVELDQIDATLSRMDAQPEPSSAADEGSAAADGGPGAQPDLLIEASD